MWEFLIPADFDPVLFKISKKILNKATNGQFDKDSFEEFVTVLEKSRSGSVRHGKSKLDFKGEKRVNSVRYEAPYTTFLAIRTF